MQKKSPEKEDFRKNLKLYYGAVLVIILGYMFLSIGDANSVTSLTIGPIVLVTGYLVAMPIALLTGIGKKNPEETVSPGSNTSASSEKTQKNKR